MTMFKVVLDAFHKYTGKRFTIAFVVTADSGKDAIDKVYDNYDLGGMDVITAVAKESDNVVTCTGIVEVI